MENSKDVVLELKNVKRYYKMGDSIVKAVNGIDLCIKRKSLIAILGPSGCGKSTMLHLMGLLDKPTQGKIFLEGKNIVELDDEKISKIRNEKIGFVFQQFFLSPTLNVEENIELPMIIKGVSEIKRKKRAKELAKMVGLEHRLKHMPQQLSGGERQRVAIARALANNPSLILADEPTGNLDSKTGKEIIDLFIKLWKKGNTLVFVTHDLNIAKYAKKIIRVLDGKILKIEEIKNEINNKY